MRVAITILLAGIVLLLSAPLIALTPLFTPPPNGCPCPEGLKVSTPLGNAGFIIGAIGTFLVILGGIQSGRIPKQPAATVLSPASINLIVAGSGVLILVMAGILSNIVLRGQGWVILLYQGQAFYLGALGIGILLFAGFAWVIGRRLSALFLAVGVVSCGTALLFTYTLSSDFATRCFPEVGCSPILADSTVSEMIDLGYLLAVGAFLLGLGLAFAFRRGGSA